MNEKQIEGLLEQHGIKLTANRILIAKVMSTLDYPISMKELETMLLTMDKSSIFRTLSLFKSHHLVHQMEDGNDTNYAIVIVRKRTKTYMYTSIVNTAIAPFASMKYLFHKLIYLLAIGRQPLII